MQVEAVLSCQLDQAVAEGNRIGTAGDSQEHSLSRTDHPVTPDGTRHFSKEHLEIRPSADAGLGPETLRVRAVAIWPTELNRPGRALVNSSKHYILMVSKGNCQETSGVPPFLAWRELGGPAIELFPMPDHR